MRETVGGLVYITKPDWLKSHQSIWLIDSQAKLNKVKGLKGLGLGLHNVWHYATQYILKFEPTWQLEHSLTSLDIIRN